MSTNYIHLANFLTSGRNDIKKFCLQHLKQGRATTLETFWKKRDLEKKLDENPDIQIFLDSGAHSLLNAQIGLISKGTMDSTSKEKTETGKVTYEADDIEDRASVNQRINNIAARNNFAAQMLADFNFNRNEDVRRYLDDYIAFIKKYDARGQLMGYVNLDIIYSAEESWNNQQYMEDHGLRPIPVFHYGEDFGWWKKYCAEYDYIGIGGVAGGLTLESFVRSLGDEAFKMLWDIDNTTKVHGFAVTSHKLMFRYPFWSVDSTTWLKHAAYGNVMVPRWNPIQGQYDYTAAPLIVSVSDISMVKEGTKQPHFTIEYQHQKEVLRRIRQFFEEHGIDEERLQTDMLERFKVDIYYYEELMKCEELHDRRPPKNSERTFF